MFALTLSRGPRLLQKACFLTNTAMLQQQNNAQRFSLLHHHIQRDNQRRHFYSKVQPALPGFVASAAVAAAASATSTAISGFIAVVPLAIIYGATVGNLINSDLRKKLLNGAKFASTNILRVGIVCVGAKLSLVDMAALGAFGAPAVAASMTLTTLFTLRLAQRLNVEPRQASLVAIGSSVCGVTAITALSPAVKASEKETAVAVAGVVLFGTSAMVAYPYVAPHLFTSPAQIGTFFGMAVHDTSQVMGAAMTYEQLTNTSNGVLQAAATTKLTRNLFLAAAVPALSMHVGRLATMATTTTSSSSSSSSSNQSTSKQSFFQYIPPFVLMFIGMVMLKSVGDMYISDPKNNKRWKRLMQTIGGPLSVSLLSIAMAGVGLNIKYD